MSKSKEKEACDSILNYLNKQNRPYSAVDIFNNLHKEHGKTGVVRALEQLAADKKIKEKIYGKQKVYAADQSQYPDVPDSELRSMDAEIAAMTKDLEEEQQVIKSLESSLNNFSSSLTTKQAKEQLTKMKAEIKKLENRINDLTSNEDTIDPEEKEKIMSSYDKNVKEWRKRKRTTTEILDSILESYPKSKKILCEEIGIETDEDVNVKFPKT